MCCGDCRKSRADTIVHDNARRVLARIPQGAAGRTAAAAANGNPASLRDRRNRTSAASRRRAAEGVFRGDSGEANRTSRRKTSTPSTTRPYLRAVRSADELFARQETANCSEFYGHPDPAEERGLRLHVIISRGRRLLAAERDGRDGIDPQTCDDAVARSANTVRHAQRVTADDAGRWEVRSTVGSEIGAAGDPGRQPQPRHHR